MARVKTGGTKLRAGPRRKGKPSKAQLKAPKGKGSPKRAPKRIAVSRATPAPSLGPDTTRPLALAAVAAARDKKGERPVLLDVRGISSYADYLLLVSAESERQVQAIADAIEERLETLGARVLGIEQPGESGWMLVDLGDLVVHLFYRGAREAYDFEGLWGGRAPRAPAVNLKVLWIGRKGRGPIETLTADYGERLSHYLTFESVRAGPAQGEDAVARVAEAEALKRRIGRHDWVVTLDERGELVTSEGLASRIQKVERSGGRDLAFLIGGPSGLDPALPAAADWSLALSRLTFPHGLARLLLVEQLYRAMTLLRGEPYHK